MEWSSEFCRKRHPTDDLNEEQPLSKRLSLLNLNYGNFNNASNTVQRRRITQPKLAKKQRTLPEQERMEVDNVVYVSDLDSDSESDADDKLVFLPDIEKKLSKIPYSLVGGRSKEQSTSTELVLYSVPSSISVPEQKDVVRRAIIEARQRLREKSAELLPNVVPPVAAPTELSSELRDGNLSGAFNQVANAVEATDAVPNGAWNGMPNDLVSGAINGGWGTWRPLDANLGIGPSENFEDLDAMEIE